MTSLNRGLPGETPLDDCSGLRLKYIRTVGQLAGAEFEGIALANAKYLTRAPSRRTAPFTLRWMLRLHKEMFGRVWRWAGKRRSTDGLNIGVKACNIEVMLEDLSRDIALWRTIERDRHEDAAILHHRAVAIHPFMNGNGRWARLLSQIWQLQETGTYTRWPEQELFDGTSALRPDYIAALRAADRGNYSPLTAMHKVYLPDTAK